MFATAYMPLCDNQLTTVLSSILFRFGGYYVRGIGANAILNVPIIGHLLTMIGIVSASRESCRSHLAAGSVIGISSGGIAEIFETNSSPGSETECIILKSRGGICKLALQTGCNLLPSYLYGNSKALNVWHDSFGIMRSLSRILRVSIVFFSGEYMNWCCIY
jgi:1-acyl-sn-glycerol-3-phosphate acyltransferase